MGRVISVQLALNKYLINIDANCVRV